MVIGVCAILQYCTYCKAVLNLLNLGEVFVKSVCARGRKSRFQIARLGVVHLDPSPSQPCGVWGESGELSATGLDWFYLEATRYPGLCHHCGADVRARVVRAPVDLTALRT